jgi:hypothetical protein
VFGGDGLDRALSDTWVYDVNTRKWEQRFPKVCPPPRAGHLLGWLPEAKRIVVAGGYSRVPLAQDIWSYDVAGNEWKLLKEVPLGGGRRPASPDCPPVNARTYLTGTVGPGDALVCFSGNTVWACRVDPSQADAGSANRGVKPGTYVWNRISPEIWEKAAPTERGVGTKFVAGLPVNQWTAFKFPKYAPGARNRWGTSAYDTDRHQFLLWGGGHATSHENDVAHFSVRGGFWTIGFHPDDPIERVYATQPTFLSFNDRVHVPIHAYKAYCYDPTAKKMFYGNRGYDPLVREWVPAPYEGLSWRGPMKSHIRTTPAGAVALSDRGFFRFDAKTNAWRKLPWNGPKPGGMWCDGPCMVYDSKRDCLWVALDKAVYRYDFATGTGQKLTPAKPKVLGRWYLPFESVYIPEADLILNMKLAKGPDGRLGNVAWNPRDSKYYWMHLKFVQNGKDVAFRKNPFNHSDALAYDPKLKLCLINNSSAQKVWALKFDKAAAKPVEMK